MKLSSANLVHNDLDICNGSADLSINDLDNRQMHPNVLDYLDFETKLWSNVGQVGQHYEFWPAF
jgi:hypothetical protein